MRKIPNFIPLQTALIDDIRIKRLNREYLNCSGLGILIGLYFYLLKNPNFTCSYDEIDIIAEELKASIPVIITVIERYNLFHVIKDSSGNKFFSPMLNNSLKPYFEVCEANKLKSDLATLKRKQRIQQQKEELKKILNQQLESNQLKLPNIIESNLNQSNSIENNSSSSHNFSWENEKDFEEFFNYIKDNGREIIKNDRYYKNTLFQNLKNSDSKTLENWNNFIAHKKENDNIDFIRRIENLHGKQILLNHQCRYIEGIKIIKNLEDIESIELKTRYFDGNVMNDIKELFTFKYHQLTEIEKYIKEENSS